MGGEGAASGTVVGTEQRSMQNEQVDTKKCGLGRCPAAGHERLDNK